MCRSVSEYALSVCEGRSAQASRRGSSNLSDQFPEIHGYAACAMRHSTYGTVTVITALCVGSEVLVAITWYVPGESGAVYTAKSGYCGTMVPPELPSWIDQFTNGAPPPLTSACIYIHKPAVTVTVFG